MFTVKDLLELDVMKSAILIAGERGINNEIKFANIMETPEVAKFMKGGEFLISAGFAFQEDEVSCRKMINDFADKKISVFGINIGRYLQTIPAAMIEECNKRGLPLVILPKNTPYRDIMVPVWNRTVSRRMEISSEQKDFYNALLDVILSEKGFVGITNTLSLLIGNPVFLTDGNYNLLSGSMTSDELQKQYGIRIRDVINRIKNMWHKKGLQNLLNPQRLDYDSSGLGKISVATMPIMVNNVLNGNLFILELNENIESDDFVALKDSAKIIAMEILKQKVGLDMQNRIQSELLEDLLSGYCDEKAFYRHVQRMNETIKPDDKPVFKTVKPMVVAFINLINFEKDIEASSIKQPYDIKTKLRNIMNEYGVNYHNGVLISSRSDCIICLFALKQNGGLDDFSDLQDYISRKNIDKCCCSVGLSNVFTEISKVKDAYDCAKIAAFSADPNKKLQVVFYNKMGVYLLLNEIKNLPEADAFCHLYLNPLLEYDSENSGELIKTLEAFFAENCNLRKTADVLYMHKNSVSYRLNKIQQLTGLDINNSDDKFNLQLSLYLLRIK